jgi:hypothetical protein
MAGVGAVVAGAGCVVEDAARRTGAVDPGTGVAGSTDVVVSAAAAAISGCTVVDGELVVTDG